MISSREGHLKTKIIESTKRLNLLEDVKDFVLELLSTSSLHGFKYLVCHSLHPLERLAWLGVVLMAVWGSVRLSLSTWTRFQENPTVVSMERNYKDWNTSFPSITICPLPKYDEENIVKIINEKFRGIKDKTAALEFLKQLSKATFGTFGEVRTRVDGIEPSDYWKVVWKLGFPFTFNVSNSNSEAYNRMEMNQVITEVGFCYSYSSVATIYYDPKEWEKRERRKMIGLKILRSSPLDGDVFAQVINMNAGYRLYVLDPTEFPDVSIPQIEGFNNSYKTLDLRALSIVSTKDVEDLSIEQRKCRLEHESNLLTSPLYSYNLCRMECRMKECYRLCKCIPYFYRPTENYPVCDLEGMNCLEKYSERLIRMLDPKSGTKIRCNCLQLCNEVNYVVDADNSMEWILGTNLKWGLTKYPKFRLKRGILFGGTELLVAVGGTAGLFFGCSLLSFAEIIYFFTLHFIWFMIYRSRAKNILCQNSADSFNETYQTSSS